MGAICDSYVTGEDINGKAFRHFFQLAGLRECNEGLLSPLPTAAAQHVELFTSPVMSTSFVTRVVDYPQPGTAVNVAIIQHGVSTS